MTDTTSDFFDFPKDHSKVKSQIVVKYVQSWARILSDFLRKQKPEPDVVYVDLFSGPGLYVDGTASTPMLLLKSAAEDPKLQTALRTYFNDSDWTCIDKLRDAIADLPTIGSLKYPPELSKEQVSVALLDRLKVPTGIPALYFLDQFGYKHVTLAMIRTLMSRRWTECIFFFNYRRVIAAIDNPAMADNMKGLFGTQDRIGALKLALLASATPVEREQTVLIHLIMALQDAGAKHVLPFAFKVEDGQRSTHHLIFLTRHDKGYELMKGIMAREGTQTSDGIPGLSFVQRQSPENLSLFPTDPIAELADELCRKFLGRTLTVDQLFLEHSPGTNFLPIHYRDACLRLESRGQIVGSPSAGNRPTIKGVKTMAKNTRVTFEGGSR
jgi:three-Cys-motif partner protein